MATPAGYWACDACTYKNLPTYASCDMCSTARPAAAAAPAPAASAAAAGGTATGGGEGEACPICGARFPASSIEAHALTCLESAAHGDVDMGRKEEEVDPTLSADIEMARKLAQQFEQESRLFPCGICSKSMDITHLYTLDECSHRFCRPCLETSILGQLREGALSSEVACATCSAPMSIRDVQDFTRRATGGATVAVHGSAGAAKRLHKELKMIQRAGAAKLGFTVALVEDSLHEWEVKMFGFDVKDAEEGALARDLQKVPGQCVVVRVVFPSDYPSKPPYVRVIRPRFMFRTGHVTIGGAICTEALSSQGWDPSMTIESVLISVRTNMVVGGGRIDLRNKTDYSAREAKVAFDRMMRTHGWV